jgi:hypothetical protein
VNLCVTHSGMMQLTLSFGQPKNDDQRMLSGYTGSCVYFVRGFGSVTPLFFITLILDVLLENSEIMLPKS